MTDKIPNYGRSPLMEPEHFEKPMADFRRSDWDTLNAQRRNYYEKNQASHSLRLLSAMENDEVFGYPINPYRHCLQSATKVFRDGHDLQTVVTALFHDVGFTVAPQMHGEFTATLLKPYISEQNHWMLAHHGEFQKYFCHDIPPLRTGLRENSDRIIHTMTGLSSSWNSTIKKQWTQITKLC